jgi:ribosomal-protein-alanine N-acetyltransferase
VPPSLALRLETPRFVLRAPRADDARLLGAALKRNAEHLAPWSPAALVAPQARTAVRLAAELARMRTAWKKDAQYNLFVFAREDTTTLLGRVTLTVQRGAFQNAYLGYWCDHARQGQGLMTECLAAAIELAYGPVGLHRLQAAIMPRNAGSIRVIEKLGFRREGLAERYLQIAGTWEDHVLYALTAEERTRATPSRS